MADQSNMAFGGGGGALTNVLVLIDADLAVPGAIIPKLQRGVEVLHRMEGGVSWRTRKRPHASLPP